MAADECVAALGSDTGGSIRQPAAFCGVVGLKPTYGRVSRYGLVAFASSLDQIGPITKDVTDAAILLGVIAGHDPRDSTSANVPVPDYLKALKKRDLRKLKIGVPAEYFIDGLDPEVEQAVRTAIEESPRTRRRHSRDQVADDRCGRGDLLCDCDCRSQFKLGAVRRGEVRFAGEGESKISWICTSKPERKDSDSEVKRRIMLGTYVLSAGYYDAYYGKAQAVRTLIRREFEAAFQTVDLIVTPVTPTPAFKFGEKAQDPLQMYLSDIFTISANLAGLPAIALPCGFSRAGLPIGLQLIGRPFEEETLLRGAHAYEQATTWRSKKPAIR